MVKSSKKIKNNIVSDKPSKSGYVFFDEYHHLFTGKLYPVSVDYVMEEARKFVSWTFEKPNEALDANSYWRQKGISSGVVARWKNNPQFKEIYEEALDQIGWNREHGGLNKKLSEGLVKFSMPMYRKAWKELTEWLSKLSIHDLASSAMPLYIKEMFYCGNCGCENCSERKEIFRKKE